MEYNLNTKTKSTYRARGEAGEIPAHQAIVTNGSSSN